MRVEGVIFDWAGTTVDYGCFAPVNVFINIFKMRGIDVTLAEAREPMGMLKRDHVKAMLSMDRINNLFIEKFNRKWDEVDVDAFYEDFEEQLFATLREYTDPVPGVLELIGRLRERDIKIGSTTGYTKEMIEIVSEEAKVKGYLPDYKITSTEVPAGRPCPYMIFKNILELEISGRSNTVKVGDTISDIKEGRSAGVWSVGVVKGGSDLGMTLEEVKDIESSELNNRVASVREKMLEAGAHYVIDEIGDLDIVLDEIEKRLKNGEVL